MPAGDREPVVPGTMAPRPHSPGSLRFVGNSWLSASGTRAKAASSDRKFCSASWVQTGEALLGYLLPSTPLLRGTVAGGSHVGRTQPERLAWVGESWINSCQAIPAVLIFCQQGVDNAELCSVAGPQVAAHLWCSAHWGTLAFPDWTG